MKKCSTLYSIMVIFCVMITQNAYAASACYENAELNAVQYVHLKSKNKKVNSQKVVSLSERGDSCVEHSVYDGVMIQNQKMYAPFSDIFKLYYNAASKDDKDAIDLYRKMLRPVKKNIDQYIRLFKEVPPGTLKVNKKILQSLGAYKVYEADVRNTEIVKWDAGKKKTNLSGLTTKMKWRYKGNALPWPSEFWLCLMYIRMNGELIPDCKMRRIRRDGKLWYGKHIKDNEGNSYFFHDVHILAIAGYKPYLRHGLSRGLDDDNRLHRYMVINECVQ